MRKKRLAAGTVLVGVLLLAGLATGFTLYWQGTGARNADAASPAQTFYLEGTIYALECDCDLIDTDDLETYRLFGDLEGFTCGDRVGVWAHSCPPEVCGDVTGCMGGRPVIVEDIVALPEPTPTIEPTPTTEPTAADPVGGIAKIPGVAESASSAHSYVALVGVVGGALVALTTGAWYARRRWLR